MTPLQSLVSSKIGSIIDPAFIKTLGAMPIKQWLVDNQINSCRQNFIDKIHRWILSSRFKSVTGLEEFPHRHVVMGVTQALDEFHFRHSHRRLRFFRGEYSYHRACFPNWSYLNDGPIEPQDAVVVSAPFCSDGKIPETLDQILFACEKQKVPVFVDCAFYAMSVGCQLQLTSPAIEGVSFSLTKGLGLGDFRIGIEYSRVHQSHLALQNDKNHLCLFNARVGIHMMESFSCDFLVENYRERQLQVCAQLDLMPSDCIHLGLAPSTAKEKWVSYMDDAGALRVGLASAFKAYRSLAISEDFSP